jgi:small subunit ribosomal protein S8
MSMTDPVADLLTRIRNGLASKKPAVELPSSKLKLEVVKILKEEGYISNFKVTEDDKQGVLKVDLRYGADGRPIITGIQKVSKPGLRVYAGSDEIKPVLGGLGISILSTSRGVMTDLSARKDRVGGEVLCKVW